MRAIRNHGFNPELSPDQQWVAFPVALELGILPDLTNATPASEYMPTIKSGIMPSCAGQIDHPSFRMAVDLIAVKEATGSRLILPPSDKEHVDRKTRLMQGMGMLILSDENLQIKPLGLVDEYRKLQWRTRKANIIQIGNGLALELFDMNTRPYEVNDIQDDGTVVAKQPKRYFSFGG